MCKDRKVCFSLHALTACSWIIHGDDDSVVYLRQSEALVELMKEKLPNTNLRFDVAKGQDHAFDIEPTLWEPYTEGAMKFVVDAWLRQVS